MSQQAWLTDRELEVAELVIQAWLCKPIDREAEISIHTMRARPLASALPSAHDVRTPNAWTSTPLLARGGRHEDRAIRDQCSPSDGPRFVLCPPIPTLAIPVKLAP